MPKISTVSVMFGRKIQTRPYESADASVSMTLAFDHEEVTRDFDEEISDAMDRAVAHVESTLGIKRFEVTENPAADNSTNKPAKQNNKPVASPVAKPKPTAKKATPAPKTAQKKADNSPDEKSLTKGDMMKAISNTLTALEKKGISDGPAKIDKIVRGYLQEDKPPYSYARIPEHSWGDFISDVGKLKNVGSTRTA